MEFLFPWGWGELEGIANRTDYDLKAHAAASGEKLEYFDQATGERYMPYVIEPAAGATRTMMAFLLAAYDDDEVGGEARTRAAPPSAAGPLPGRRAAALPQGAPGRRWPERCSACSSRSPCATTTRPSRSAAVTGARTRSARPLAVTVDFDSLEDRAVTIRDRDTTEQVRVPIAGLVGEVTGGCGWTSVIGPGRASACSAGVRVWH